MSSDLIFVRMRWRAVRTLWTPSEVVAEMVQMRSLVPGKTSCCLDRWILVWDCLMHSFTYSPPLPMTEPTTLEGTQNLITASST